MYQYCYMASPIVSTPSRSAEQYDAPQVRDDRAEFVEAPEQRNRAGRGILAGVLLGAGFWTVILGLTGVIRL
jgi:hypothetical protein